jgi:hypothetical protein
MQRVQLAGTDWNDNVPDDTAVEWNRWISEVPSLGDIVLRRCLRESGRKVADRMLVVFGDASDVALGMAVYLRVKYSDGHCEVHLLMAKSKVASKHIATLPRKELAAALAASRLLVHVCEALEMNPKEARCFTDSMTTLQWLRKHPRTWKQWVANRVTTIHELTGPEQWRHVAGPDNPADLPSRGITAAELAGNSFWFHGPSWLLLEEAQWPRTTAKYTVDYLEEQKGPLLEEPAPAALVLQQEAWQPLDSLWRRSDWEFIVRTTVRILRWLPKYRREEAAKLRLLATDWWVRREQQRHFAEELRCLEEGKPLPGNSSLTRLDPFVRDGLLRVGGRLPDHPCLSEDERQPIILPKTKIHRKQDVHCSVTARIIESAHRQHLHAGPDWLRRHLRDRYWIMAGRTTVRSVTTKCVECQAATKKLMQQKMAPLPPARLGQAKAWVDVGVDFTGPFGVRPFVAKSKKVMEPAAQEKKGRGRPRKKPLPQPTEKAYVLIFTDLATRAVHFEVTRGMNVETFFRAFARFTARRGLPLRLYSDEATNFVRAKLELIHLLRPEEWVEFRRRLDCLGIEWSLNTPYAPFRGGAWERLLRSFKETLRRTVSGRVLTEEELATLAAEIEGMMNDRPLYQPSADPEDLPITPSMLMHGRQLGQLPTPAEGAGREPVAELWRRRKALFDAAWKTFFAVYVRETLPKFRAWQEASAEEVKVGQIVLLATEKPARGHWPRARVIAINAAGRGRDGITRTVTVRLPDGTEFVRPVQQLVRLELDYAEPGEDELVAVGDPDGEGAVHDRPHDAEAGGVALQPRAVRDDSLHPPADGAGGERRADSARARPGDPAPRGERRRSPYQLRQRKKKGGRQ